MTHYLTMYTRVHAHTHMHALSFLYIFMCTTNTQHWTMFTEPVLHRALCMTVVFVGILRLVHTPPSALDFEAVKKRWSAHLALRRLQDGSTMCQAKCVRPIKCISHQTQKMFLKTSDPTLAHCHHYQASVP